MAKKQQQTAPLTFTEIVLRGDSETIRQALEARSKIDALLEEREAAYQRISELESQVESIVGEEGVFPFPAPPAPVSAFPASTGPSKPAKKAAAKPKPEAKQASETPAQDERSGDKEKGESPA